MTEKTMARVDVGVFFMACYGIGFIGGKVTVVTDVSVWVMAALTLVAISVLYWMLGRHVWDRFCETL